MTNYYENQTHLSTSQLKKVLRPAREMPETDALEFGQMVDTLLSEYQPAIIQKALYLIPSEIAAEAINLARAYTNNNKLPFNGLSRTQWEIYRTVEIGGQKVKTRGKLDHWMRKLFVEDWKTGKMVSYTKSGIESLVDFLDYDMQAYNYLKLTGENAFYFSFLCRKKVELFQYKITDKLLDNGRVKVEKAIKLYYERANETV
jgi:hypothetical protein